jgi:hypothetical protein
MAISRPLLLALLGIVLLGATVVAVNGARSTSATDQSAPAASRQAAAQAKPAAQLSPKEALQSAFAVDGIKSARFDGTLSVAGQGAQSGTIGVEGAFQRGGPDDLPKLDLNVQAKGDGADFDFGFVSTGDKGYLVSDGTGYELPADLWSQALSQQGQASATTAPASQDLDPSAWVENVKSEGTEQLDGVETQHVSATVDPAAALRDISKLVPSGAGALSSPELGALKHAEVDTWVGTDDRLARRMQAEFSGNGATVKLDLRLTQVNDPQEIEAPDKVSDSLPAGILGGASPAFSSGLSLATGADPKTLALPANDNPQRLARAVKDHRKALLFFHQERGLDDKATAESVRATDRRTKALVLTDDVRNSKRYGELVEDLGVTQAPSIVIVDRDGKAHLIEGYVDSGTLVQELSDAR